jgi:glutaredoxin
MKKALILFIWSGLSLFLCGDAMGDLFRWMDEKGVIHISDYPPPNQKNVLPLASGKDEPNPAINRPDLPNNASLDNKTDKAINGPKTPRIELYTTSWCPYCRQARNFFQSRQIPFTEYDVEKDKDAALRKRQLDPRSGVPLAVINGQLVHGFSEPAYKKALGENP